FHQAGVNAVTLRRLSYYHVIVTASGKKLKPVLPQKPRSAKHEASKDREDKHPLRLISLMYNLLIHSELI
nr:hypothetical protein [Victivallales bacterium]